MRLTRVLKRTITEFLADDCMALAAALAYYTLFALPPLLLVIISIVGLAFGHETAQVKIRAQFQDLIGSSAASQIGTIVQKAGEQKSSGTLSAVLGLIALAFGATSAFAQLQTSLNAIWHVKADPRKSELKSFLTHRLLSFGMVVSLGFLLLASLAVSAALAAAGTALTQWLPFSTGVRQAIEFVVSLVTIAALFAAIFKVLPDVKVTWNQAWTGGIATALLFNTGKHLIGLYVAKSGAASAYGQAGSLVLIVLWIYYSSLIVLFGAEFTRVLSETLGNTIEPKEGAVVSQRAA